MEIGLVVIAAFTLLVLLVVTRFDSRGDEGKITGRGGDFSEQ